MSDVLRDALRSVLNPKSVAVIGASENENKIGGARGHVSAERRPLAGSGSSSAGPFPRRQHQRKTQYERRHGSEANLGGRGHVSAAGARLRAAGRSSTGPLPPLSAPTRTMK
jgi:hypothetical protein